ncbi:hypothetical protein J2Y02_000316 [Neobacillus drentensis]|nr:hypothetical protein [Neobacillus drentensis]
MHLALKEEKSVKFEQLLDGRNSVMTKVQIFRADHPDHQYSLKDIQLLEDSRFLDQQMSVILQENLTVTQHSLNQIKQNKQVSKKYLPYIKQTNGVFLDSKK